MINYNIQTNSVIVTDSENPNLRIEVFRKDRTDDELKVAGQQYLNDYLQQQKNWDQVPGNPVRDDTYMNGSLARSDYTITTTEGQAIKAKLLADWPTEVPDYQNSDINLVAEYTANRPPYVNDSISWYSFGHDRPPAAIRTAYSLSNSTKHYREWFGLKFDKVTKNVLCKAVYTWRGFLSNKRNDMVIPTLPKWLRNPERGFLWNRPNCYVAMIHDKSGNINEYYDIYFTCHEYLLKEWCEENSITFSHTADIKDHIMIYGMTVKGTTGEIKYVKAYTRYFL